MGSGRHGCITDTVWSSSDGITFSQAYDAEWPHLDRDPALLELARAASRGFKPSATSGLFIEENLLRRIGQAYCDAEIQ